MKTTLAIVLSFSVFLLLTLVLIGWLKNVSIRNNWFDWPTDRGSHYDPVPNIGGLGMVISVFVAIILIFYLSKMALIQAFVWLFAVAALGIVGFFDDIKELSRRLRLFVHMIVGIVTVYICGGINQLDLGFIVLNFGNFSYILGFLWVVGFINMYNFMDGINGLAGTQALISALILSLWFYLFGQTAQSLILLSIAAASGGFLYWNLTPAKVFMGDAGSTMLGGVFAIACLTLHNTEQLPILFPAIIFAWFLLDTSITLIKRLVRGEKIWQAHRQHFYQQLALTPEDHTKVTGMISLVTLIISLIITVVLFKQIYV